MNRLGLTTLAFCLSLAATGCQASGKSAARAPQTSRETSAKDIFPEFKVKTLEGKEISLNQYRGKIVILDLFATWCPPCRMTIPHLVELQQKYKDRLIVVGLSYDQGDAGQVKAFLKEMKINYDVFWGSEELARYVGLRGIPHMLVLDAKGRLFRSYVGYRDKAVFEKDIQDLESSNHQS